MKHQLERFRREKEQGFLRLPYDRGLIRDEEDSSYVQRASCCETASLLIFLMVRSDYDYPEDHEKAFRPYWTLRTYKILYCPFCGTKLPDEFEKVDIGKPVVSWGGDWNCGTCRERYEDCECLPMEAKWRIKE